LLCREFFLNKSSTHESLYGHLKECLSPPVALSIQGSFEAGY
jgi:hypothetical protein